MARTRTVHVHTRLGRGWVARRHGTNRAMRSYDTRAEAIRAAVRSAGFGGRVFVQTSWGTVQYVIEVKR